MLFCLVFYQTEKTTKEKLRKKSSLLLKSSPNNALNVGDGLDLGMYYPQLISFNDNLTAQHFSSNGF